MTTPASPLSVQDFASRIRAKYPGAYDSLPDQELAQRVVAKHPEYQGKVALTPSQGSSNEAPEGFWHSFGSQIAGMLNAPAPGMPIMPQAAASMANDFMTAARQSQRPISPETGLPIPDPTGNLRNLHTAAALLTPLGGGSLEKFLEQTESGNLRGAAGTGLGVALPFAVGAKASPKAGATDPLSGLSNAAARVKSRAIMHDAMTRIVMDPAQEQLRGALTKATIAEVPKDHPISKLLDAKTGKQFVEALRNEETGEELDRSLRDLSTSGNLDPQFRSRWLKESEAPYDFVNSGGGRNFRGVFGSIMSRPGWAIVGMELGNIAGKAAGVPFVGRALGASQFAKLGETIEGKALARDLLRKMPPEKPTGFLGPTAAQSTTPAMPAVDPAAARANALMRARSPEMFGQQPMAPDARAARIAQILQEAKGSEGGLAERRTASSPAPASTTPKPTVDTAELVSVGRNLGMRPEEAQARAQEAIAQFPNDQNAAIQYMAGRKAPQAAPKVGDPGISPLGRGVGPETLQTSQILQTYPHLGKPIPEAGPIPQEGQFAAVRTEDGQIFADQKWQQSTHAAFMKRMGIPPDKVVDSGWLKDGVYESADRGDIAAYAERAKAALRLAAKPKPVSGGATPAPATAELLRARQMQVAGEGMPARPATAGEQAWTDAMANFGVPSAAQEPSTPAQKPAGIVNNPEFVSQRQRSNLAKNQRQMVGTASGATQDTAFFQQAKAELGPSASDSQIVLRAQQLKVDALKALRAAKKK